MASTYDVSPLDNPNSFYVYILASANRVLYVGMTNSLVNRVGQHKYGDIEGFTKRYRVTNLVYWECFDDVRLAINREKELKGWRREKKVALIEEHNPKWLDLAAAWFGQSDEKVRRNFARKSKRVLSDTGVKLVH